MDTLTIGPFGRVLLLGGGELLVALCESAQALSFAVAVVTSPRHADEPVGGATLTARLERMGVAALVTETIDTEAFAAFVGDVSATLTLSVGASWLFTPAIITSVFHDRLFNVHGTRLPQNRGGGGFSWQILSGNRFGFCAVHRVDAGIDTGDIVFSEEFLYPAPCRIPADYQAYYVARTTACLSGLLASVRRQARACPVLSQPEYLSSYWPRLHTPTQAWIDWTWPAAAIERFICAFDDPYPGAQTQWRDRTVSLKKASLNLQDGHFHPFQAGLVYRVGPGWMCVALHGAALVVEDVTESGEAVLSQVKVGDRFHTPPDQLEQAARRVSYGPGGLKS